MSGEGSLHLPGQNSSHNESTRERVGAHLVFNEFWLVSNFRVHQMSHLMGYSMHTINLGIILTLIRAILQAFLEEVEVVLNIQGRAASNLEVLFHNVLARKKGHKRQRYMQYMQNMNSMSKNDHLSLHVLNAMILFIYSLRGIHNCLVPVTPYLARSLAPAKHRVAWEITFAGGLLKNICAYMQT